MHLLEECGDGREAVRAEQRTELIDGDEEPDGVDRREAALEHDARDPVVARWSAAEEFRERRHVPPLQRVQRVHGGMVSAHAMHTAARWRRGRADEPALPAAR